MFYRILFAWLITCSASMAADFSAGKAFDSVATIREACMDVVENTGDNNKKTVLRRLSRDLDTSMNVLLMYIGTQKNLNTVMDMARVKKRHNEAALLALETLIASLELSHTHSRVVIASFDNIIANIDAELKLLKGTDEALMERLVDIKKTLVTHKTVADQHLVALSDSIELTKETYDKAEK